MRLITQLEDRGLQDKYKQQGAEQNFKRVIATYIAGIEEEIDYIKRKGNKRNTAVDGLEIKSLSNRHRYIYEVDSDLDYPAGLEIKIYYDEENPNEWIAGNIVYAGDYNICFDVDRDLKDSLSQIEYSVGSWYLFTAFLDRLKALNGNKQEIAKKIAIEGINHMDHLSSRGIETGATFAKKHTFDNDITFIWGPPGTGKTELLANIANEAINRNMRVLMVSYSNVSVDEATLRVAGKMEDPEGKVVRYGNSRSDEILDRSDLWSFQLVLKKNKKEKEEYDRRRKEIKEYNRIKDSIQDTKEKKKAVEKYIQNKDRVKEIHEKWMDEEKELIKKAPFVATTVAKLIVDRVFKFGRFDMVIFDEASMALVPQVILAAGFAKKHFCCMGDFCQLPSIVMNEETTQLKKDIFEHTGIREAVSNKWYHDWLVMLNTQHRMHPDIASFLSANMYQKLLHSVTGLRESRDEIAKLNPLEGRAIVFADLSGMYSLCTKTFDQSHVNLLSAMITCKMAVILSKDRTVGIITPYSAQARLINQMLRDLKRENIRCATVHQFQGSEDEVILYDMVDCYWLRFPGALLTSRDEADRLFNVAMSRTEGKFITIAHFDYVNERMNNPSLLFSKLVKEKKNKDTNISGKQLLHYLSTGRDTTGFMVGDKEETWEQFLSDIEEAKKKIIVNIPGEVDCDDERYCEWIDLMEKKGKEKVAINVCLQEDVTLPDLENYKRTYTKVVNPVVIIDDEITWFGHPLSNVGFIIHKQEVNTKYFPCIRFKGRFTTRQIKAYFCKIRK